MNNNQPSNTLLIAEDDADDRVMIEEVFRENFFTTKVKFVEDGEELMSYLNRVGKYDDSIAYPMPQLILLDLNMPRKDGREALKEMKSDKRLRRIPVVVFTTSHAQEDIIKTYNLGVSGYITKPVTYRDLVHFIKTLNNYWFEVVQLPHRALTVSH